MLLIIHFVIFFLSSLDKLTMTQEQVTGRTRFGFPLKFLLLHLGNTIFCFILIFQFLSTCIDLFSMSDHETEGTEVVEVEDEMVRQQPSNSLRGILVGPQVPAFVEDLKKVKDWLLSIDKTKVIHGLSD